MCWLSSPLSHCVGERGALGVYMCRKYVAFNTHWYCFIWSLLQDRVSSPNCAVTGTVVVTRKPAVKKKRIYSYTANIAVVNNCG